MIPDDQDVLKGPCPWAVRSAALSPRGNLVACCGIEAEGNRLLDFGSARDHGADALVENADDHVLVNAIALLGPMFLKGFIQQRAPAVRFRDRYSCMCEVCEHIVGRDETIDLLQHHLAELASCVLDSRSLLGDAVESRSELPPAESGAGCEAQQAPCQ